jgi:hypothetical protein
VLIDKLMPGTPANIDARFTGTNTVEVKTVNVDAFTLQLKGHPSCKSSEPLNVKINGIAIQSAPRLNHSFRLKEGKWVAEKYEAPVMAKKQGLEGPLSEVMSNRVILVYGTQGTSGMQEVQERRAFVKKAADYSINWGNYDQPSAINPRILADREVSADDYLSSNLVLFGTRETNSVLAKLADKLPVHLNADAKEYGLAYTFPVNGKMVVVVSGIPFWTSKPAQPGANPGSGSPRMRLRFATGSGLKALPGMKDFLLFKETNDQIISEGYFDNDWKLPAEAVQKMKVSGVVSIK